MLGVDEGGSGGSCWRADEVYHRGEVAQQILGRQVTHLQYTDITPLVREGRGGQGSGGFTVYYVNWFDIVSN